MPYSDPIKKKKHYDRYQKPYMVKWRNENRDDWNSYQKNYKVRKRFEIVENIENEIVELNIASKGTMIYNASVIFLYMLQTGIKKEWAIHYRTGIKLEDVIIIIKNWTKYGVWNHKEKVFNLEKDWNTAFNIALLSMVGSGEVVAVHIKTSKTDRII